ncbi:nucleolar protein 9 isoform X2 [Poecile atricapillus]|uniref:nucleolar protein 9 isoform X2 n=1 Tax=Poecile atricapillus TaxID=48891 RepID=UPI00273A256B|nr:nucleolar protein 9 isoform X2 [Poecile atricapillus]
MAAHTGSPPGPELSRQRRQAGPRLDPDTAEYFRRALETLEEGLSEEELALFTPNVLSEAALASPALALTPLGCRLLLLLLPRAPPSALPPFLGALPGVPTHPRGSRVLQAALGRIPGVLGEAPGLLEEPLARLAREVATEPGGLARDPNGSFVLRALLGVLGGTGDAVPPPEGAEPKVKKAWPPQKGVWPLQKEAWPPQKGAELPASFRPLLEELAEGLEREMPSLLAPPCASLCLQGALFALHRSQSPSCSRFCRALIGCLARHGPAHPQSPLLTSLQDPARSRLLEAAMTVLDPPGLRELFRGHLRGHLRGVASHRVANHGLQRLLDHAPEDVVEEALSELGPALQEPLARGHPGVVVALLGAAQRHPRLQGAALRWLFQALRCWDPPHHPHCVTALAQLRPLGGGDSDEKAEPEGKGAELEGKGAEPEPFPIPTLWGSLALQLLLSFGDPSPIWGSLGSLPPPALLGLARSPPGSRIWDSILGSPGAPPRARRRLLRKLQGHWPSLARDRSGSRVLDAAWASGRPRQRARMAEELAPHLPDLLRDPLGRGVARNLGLELFKKDPEKWAELQRGAGLGGRGLIL